MQLYAEWLSKGDGSGRPLRQVQRDVFRFLAENWHSAKFKALQCPVGAGKSLISKTIQDSTSGAIIAPSNLLIRQYQDTYPTCNDLMGRKHYSCTSNVGMDCMTVKDNNLNISESGEIGGYCEGCPYVAKRTLAFAGVPTFFNPMSYMNMGQKSFNTLIIDEAHQLVSMMMMTTGFKFWNSKTKLPENARNEFEVIAWFDKIIPGLNKNRLLYSFAIQRSDGRDKESATKKLLEIEETLEAIKSLREGLSKEPQNYAIWYEESTLNKSKDSCLNIKPIRVPKYAMNRLYTGIDNIVLMSGTLMEHDLKDLTAGKEYSFGDFPSPIPKERRLIYHEPTPYAINYQTDPQQLAKDILKKCKENPGNTIIHVTYEWSRKLTPYMPPQVLINTADNKDKILEKFKKQGGIFLAAGCSEGIDLADDLCRTNIIPVLVSPSLMDEVVKKRKSLEDGDTWYAMETLKTCIQQAGRSTRNENDFSRTIVMVPYFKSLVKRFWHKLPQSFSEAIVFEENK